MTEDTRQLLHGLDLGPGCRPQDVAAAEHELGIKFPSDYAEFLLAYDGGEGTLGTSYLHLYSVETLREVSREWLPPESRSNTVMFGSDGGGEGYAFDFCRDPMTYVQLPIIAAAPEDKIDCGKTFGEFLIWVSEGRSWKSRPGYGSGAE